MYDQTTWQFYTSSIEAWEAMLTSIASANESIDLEQFILSYDSIGIRFLEALKERARAGLKVRIFCDEVGSFSLYRANIVSELEATGIQIKFFNSVIPWNPNKETLWFFRDHRKLLVIDKKIGFTGGMCLGDAMRDWRESSVRIVGPVVSQMTEAFEIMWNKSYHKFKYYFKRKKKGIDPETPDFEYITNAPLPGKRYMYTELIRAVKSAKHYIYLTTPYLLPDSRLLRNLKKACRRGLEVRLLVPENTNSKLVNIGAGTFFKDMLEAGIHIFRFKGPLIHAKTGVIDGKWSTIGSLNLDNLSLRYNFEGNIVSIKKEFTFELERQFLDDLKNAKELTLEEWNKRSYLRRLLEILVWPLRKLL
ncbi:MAG: phospholipase D-like domain-containing protein [Patescibacteria group bacterium]